MAFKINTVVNTFNVDEDMQEDINKLDPVRWKVSAGTGDTEVRACPPPSPILTLMPVSPGVPVFAD